MYNTSSSHTNLIDAKEYTVNLQKKRFTATNKYMELHHIISTHRSMDYLVISTYNVHVYVLKSKNGWILKQFLVYVHVGLIVLDLTKS